MARLIHLANLQSEYPGLVRLIAEEGSPALPRGLPTREVRDVTLHFRDTSNLLPVGVGRGVSTKLNAYNAAALVAGVHWPALALAIVPGLARFEADGVDRERYGPRTISQVEGVVHHLMADSDTREAIVTLQPPRTSDPDGGRDFPCTTSIQFLLREGLLHMTVSMRSNDVWHGLSGDAWTFGQLQATLAWVLGVGVGGYTHHAASLHLYESDLPKIVGLMPDDGVPTRPGLLHVDGFKMPYATIAETWWPLRRLWDARALAHGVLGGRTELPEAETRRESTIWYRHQLESFWRH